ncbi:MAG TPA: hypothetical protein VLM39_09850 [Ignavibacteriaceae bacterium]|nr:hypothetical protein [Ignavibacteriaceae bacterium]
MEEVFYKYIDEVIQNGNNLKYEWRENNTEILFQKISSQGFDIIIRYDENNIYLETDTGYHDYFKVNNNFKEVLIDVMGIIRDLLTRNMRIKEYLSNNRSYKWTLQCFRENKWKDESSTGLIFWNYFGKKSEKIYFNNSLPIRELNK